MGREGVVPCVQLLTELSNNFRVRFAEVVFFQRVLVEIVQLEPAGILVGNELPVGIHNRPCNPVVGLLFFGGQVASKRQKRGLARFGAGCPVNAPTWLTPSGK